MGELKFRVVRTAGGWDGTITIPFMPDAAAAAAARGLVGPNGGPATGIVVKASGASKETAAKKTAAAALKMLNNPLVQSVLPPQATVAINVLKKVPFKKIGNVAKKLKFW
jgi:Fe-S oxidoreductase